MSMSLRIPGFLRGGLDHRSAIRLGGVSKKSFISLRIHTHTYRVSVSNCTGHFSARALVLTAGTISVSSPLTCGSKVIGKVFKDNSGSKTVEEDTKDPAPDWSVFFVWLRVWRSGRGRKQSQVILRRCLRMNRRTWRCYGAVMNVCFLGSCSKSSRGKGSLLYLLDFEPARNLF